MLDLIDFSIHSWYILFKHITLPTIQIEIPDVLLDKLKSDDSDVNLENICGNEYVEKLRNAINSLDRNVFVKNNWHAPMDAKIFSFGNQLKVTSIDDLKLYLSASNIISEDFSNQSNIPFYIALKPWKSIHPASEFRCIVINNILRGITPRDWPTYYAHFKEEGPQIVDTLSTFFKENILNRFPRKTYTFDIVLSYPDKPYILDFGPLNNKTNLYAFNWKEISPLLHKVIIDSQCQIRVEALEEVPEEIPAIFRYLESDIGIMSKADAIFKIANSFS